MIAFLIFYWIFSIWFAIGIIYAEQESFTKSDILVLILISPFVLPVALGMWVELSCKYLEQIAKHKKE